MWVEGNDMEGEVVGEGDVLSFDDWKEGGIINRGGFGSGECIY